MVVVPLLRGMSKNCLPQFRIHDLRHQYASFLVNSGRTLNEVLQVLGHSDPKVTQRYAHLSTKSLQDAANSASITIQRGMPMAKVAEPTDVAAHGEEVAAKAA
jgi:hypothetical protein